MDNIRVILILLCLSSFLACTVEEDPKSFITPDEFFGEDRDAQSAVDAIYKFVNGGSGIYAGPLWQFNVLASDIASYIGGDYNLAEFSTFNFSPENQIVAEIYRSYFAAINSANYAIKNIPTTPLTESEQAPFMTEARFWRAVFYFDLMRLFGGVPLVLQPYEVVGQDYSQPRQSFDSLGQFVEEELTFAFENLPSNNAPGRPNRLTAAAFLSKYYLTTDDFTRAFQASRIVLQSLQGNLLADYASIFIEDAQNTIEDIISININADDPNRINRFTLPSGLKGKATIMPTATYVNAFDVLDRRRQINLLTTFQDRAGLVVEVEPHVRKFWDGTNLLGGVSANDLPLIRVADVMLLHCEAINELRNGSNAEALGVINQVRARARFDGSMNQEVLPDLVSLNKAAFREAILNERLREVGFEGHRWFDLVRMDVLKEKVELAKPGIVVEEKHHLLPIPRAEFFVNPNLGSQNPGY